MGLTAQAIKYIFRCKKKYRLKGPVLTLGNQDIYATEGDIEKWLKEEKLPVKVPTKIKRSTSHGISQISKETTNYLHAESFFEYLGIPEKEYFDIDKFDFDKPKIIHDLERPLPLKYHNYFNLIIDSGTLEHIFDVKSVLSNMVKVTKLEGYILQFIPAEKYLNHGFYQFSPTLFYDFYTANGFEIVESYMTETRNKSVRFYSYDQKRDYTGLFFNPFNRISNCFLVKKTENLNKIVSPVQYYYKILSQNSDKIENDFNKTLFDKTVKIIRSIIPIKYHGVFFAPWIILKNLTARHKYFDIH